MKIEKNMNKTNQWYKKSKIKKRRNEMNNEMMNDE